MAAKYNRADRLAVVLAYVIAIGLAVVSVVGLVWAIDLMCGFGIDSFGSDIL